MSLGEIPGGNLRAYYKLEGLTDSSGNGFTLTNNNSVSFATQGKFTYGADAGSSGTNKGLTLGSNVFSSTTPSDVAISFWFKLNSTANVTQRLLTSFLSKTSATDGFTMNIDYNITSGTLNLRATRFLTVSDATATISTTPDTNWHYFIAVTSGTNGINSALDRLTTGSTVGTGVDRSFTTFPTKYAGILNNRALTQQALAIVDEVIVDENLYIGDSSNNGPRWRYYTQAKGRFCI